MNFHSSFIFRTSQGPQHHLQWRHHSAYYKKEAPVIGPKNWHPVYSCGEICYGRRRSPQCRWPISLLSQRWIFDSVVSLGALKVGRYYDLALLPDYQPQLFDLDKDKLIQHNIMDKEDQIIPCWSLYDRLHLGMLLLCKVTLHAWNIGTHEGKFKRVRCIFLKILNFCSLLGTVLYTECWHHMHLEGGTMSCNTCSLLQCQTRQHFHRSCWQRVPILCSQKESQETRDRTRHHWHHRA